MEDAARRYVRCDHCRLVSVPARFHLGVLEEKLEYDKHQNLPYDPGYRRFLSRLAQPLLQMVDEGSRGLDFGCGPGPTLALMLRERGLQVELYDKFYYPQEVALDRSYDFVTATEVVEHLRHPATDLEKMWACVKPGGVLAIMTKLVLTAETFASWHYKNDPTHILFFSFETLVFIAKRWQAKLERVAIDAFIFRKT